MTNRDFKTEAECLIKGQGGADAFRDGPCICFAELHLLHGKGLLEHDKLVGNESNFF